MEIKELVLELVAQVNAGEDIANEDAGALFRWLDANSAAWRELSRRAVDPQFMLSIRAKNKKGKR